MIILTVVFSGCREKTLFSSVDPSQSGLNFENRIVEDEENNVMTYEYTYNGGGVAVGDLNNDGLADIYLSANMTANKLFLNRGDLKFEDITEDADIKEKKGWKTGVTMADVNGDGWLDIYLCYSGNSPAEGFDKPVIREFKPRANQLFIHTGKLENGIPRFVERSGEYGLDATGTFSTQAYFLDFDLDGDLDMFLLNHANKFYSTFFNVKKLRNERHPYFGNKLYRNDNNRFIEVSEVSGIHGGGLNFGLSAAISDLNKDGWPDIYVTNDYDEQDYCYLNNQDGTFLEISHTAFGHLSKFGMGSDIADINNDGLPDIFVADMLPEDNYRQKVLKGPDEYKTFRMAVDNGYHYQYMRNTLHLNQGISPDSLLKFNEVGQLSGISNTDWSWAPLFADYDNDGLKDLFVTNGYLRDYSNLDFVKFTANKTISKAKSKNRDVALLPLLSKMPSTKIPNYIFKNTDGLNFKKMTTEWGLNENTVSNAAAYADFDNDGDLDLLVSDLNSPVRLYRNNQEKLSGNNFIKIRLKGKPKNSSGVGAKVVVALPNGQELYHEANFGRGYQSSVEPIINIGLGSHDSVDKIEVYWPGGEKSTLTDVQVNSKLEIDQSNAVKSDYSFQMAEEDLLEKVTAASGLDFKHEENDYVDFYYESLTPYQLSRLGGKMATGDVNNDGNDDVYFAGASGQAAKLFLGNEDTTFSESTENQPWLHPDNRNKEDSCPLFFDVDNDGDLDLYVVSGGNENPRGGNFYQDQLYINAGNGQFIDGSAALPSTAFSGGVVAASDVDHDGDLDLFVGGRLDAQNYPFTPPSMLLRNDFDGKSLRFTPLKNNDLAHIGMVTDAVWVDLDKDGWQDLVIVGEWMPVSVFRNEKGVLVNLTPELNMEHTSGWWNTVEAADIDSDGDMDILLGNMGTNTQFRASGEEPMVYYVQDMNEDGQLDPILSYYIQGESYPLPGRDEMLGQVNGLKKVYTTYDKYATSTARELLKAGNVTATSTLTISQLQSGYLRNDGELGFSFYPFPDLAQQSCINDFLLDDFTGDGKKELLIAGNFYPLRVSLGRMDASRGMLLSWKDGAFEILDKGKNLWLQGDIRDIGPLRFNNGSRRLIISRNNDTADIYAFPSKKD